MNLKPKGLEGGEVREVFSGTIHHGLAPFKNNPVIPEFFLWDIEELTFLKIPFFYKQCMKNKRLYIDTFVD